MKTIDRIRLDAGITAVVRDYLTTTHSTMTGLAYRAGLSLNDLSQPLNGRRHWSMHQLLALASYLDLSLSDFIAQAESHPSAPIIMHARIARARTL
jgi:transcriptional regulator with XRE-family HTH domain